MATKSKEDELKKPVTGFSEYKYISMFGRLLWFAYESPDKLEKVAKLKLLGHRKYAKYDPDNKHYVLTALFFCVALDVYLENLESLLFVPMLVNSHLRVVVIIDQNTGILHISTLSKLILALAAIKLFSKKTSGLPVSKQLCSNFFS